MKTKQQPEFALQCQVSAYMEVAHPKIIYRSDTVSFVKLTAPQAMRNKKVQKNGFKFPDIEIYEPRSNYAGLMIELKAETPYKKDGTLKANPHVEEQAKCMQILERKGYKCTFCWSFDQFVNILNDYLKCCQ